MKSIFKFLKSLQRFNWLFMSIGIALLGVLFAFDPMAPRGLGIAMVVVGTICTCAMSYVLFGKKNSN